MRARRRAGVGPGSPRSQWIRLGGTLLVLVLLLGYRDCVARGPAVALDALGTGDGRTP
ncbi:MAG: hypothetical protein ACOYM9_04210 [Bradymonadia bacterium]|jgi:hypothetical protein